MKNWLDAGHVPMPTSSELANWVRLLPSSKVSESTKKAIARNVLERDIDGLRFDDIVSGARWSEIGVSDVRETASLTRLFKQKQQETKMAEAAKETGRINRQFAGLKAEKSFTVGH